jgi:hypothetical protein
MWVKIHLSSAIDNDQNNTVDSGNGDDTLQTFSKTCSMVFDKINKKQFEYLQAITSIQEDMLGSCNSLVKNQIDLIEEYSKSGIVTKELIIPIIETANKRSRECTLVLYTYWVGGEIEKICRKFVNGPEHEPETISVFIPR